MQIGVFTATPSAPSSTRICATVPSSTASTSMVALSVSISQITWPDFTTSPTFTCHLASLPSVMVGDRAGIKTGMDIRSGLDQDVGPQFRWVGLGTVLRIFRRVVHDLADLGIDALSAASSVFFSSSRICAHGRSDRARCDTCRLFLGPVPPGPHRMAAVA
jgi:hypothetical protein